eukprot:TRINITY_DN103430_c0_g1_i1.p1 TRINITY_DN103430_c0_g1~~TRINITY_DN103430_c0_g1_i1.p1  ORF type:complete len:334 (+),score=61.75 TRINITY_DN103430_c0_g1_i1:64-1065(+)
MGSLRHHRYVASCLLLTGFTQLLSTGFADALLPSLGQGVAGHRCRWRTVRSAYGVPFLDQMEKQVSKKIEKMIPSREQAREFFGGSVQLPSTVERLLQGLKSSIEEAFQKDLTRMDVELPEGLHLGLEGTVDALEPLPAGTDVKERLAQTEREAANAFVQVFGGRPELCVAFRTPALATAAMQIWGSDVQSLVLSLREKSKLNFRKSVKARKCSVLVVVAPRAEQLQVLDELDKEFASAVHVILVNARLRSRRGEDALRDRMATRYEPIYAFRFIKKGKGLLFKALTEAGATQWFLMGRAPNDGPSDSPWKELLRSSEEPSATVLSRTLASGT